MQLLETPFDNTVNFGINLKKVIMVFGKWQIDFICFMANETKWLIYDSILREKL